MEHLLVYSERKKNIAKTEVPSRNPTTFALASVRFRKIRNGISGAWERVDHEEDADSAAAPSRRPTVVPDPQWCLSVGHDRVDEQRQTRGDGDGPATSNRLWPRSARDSCSSIGASTTAAAPTGTLTKKIHAQPR